MARFSDVFSAFTEVEFFVLKALPFRFFNLFLFIVILYAFGILILAVLLLLPGLISICPMFLKHYIIQPP